MEIIIHKKENNSRLHEQPTGNGIENKMMWLGKLLETSNGHRRQIYENSWRTGEGNSDNTVVICNRHKNYIKTNT
jgi:hypothetical protein